MAIIGVVAAALCLAVAEAVPLSDAGITQSAKDASAGESRIASLMGRPQGWDLHAGAVKEKAISLLAEGQQPMGVKSWITSQLIPQTQQTVVEMQGQVDQAKQQIEQCKQLQWSAEKEVKHRESILAQDESQRFQCIAEEHRLFKAEQDACDDLQNLIDLVVKNQPPTLTAIVNKTTDAVEDVLRKNHQFVNDFNQKMVDKQSTCMSATQAAMQAHAECSADEDVIEAFYCTMKYGRDQSCAAYDGCYVEKVAAFDKTLADVRELESHTKEQFKKLTCFSRGISDTGGTDSSPECDPATLNLAHLTITYPPKPPEAPCVPIMKTRRDYSQMVTCSEGSVIPHGEITVPDSNSTQLLSEHTTIDASLSARLSRDESKQSKVTINK